MINQDRERQDIINIFTKFVMVHVDCMYIR